MKTTKFIANVLVTVAAIAGAVYVVATYGEQIVAWCKKVLASLPCNCKVEIVSEAAQEEAPAAEEEAEEEATEEAAVEEAPVEEKAEEAVAEEADFAE
ncbi:MAG: hypothetical protein IJO31_05285 [Oscillospiraceae bacterium]|nr:hypothetical protein [Oscillospiraceae bacterium]